MSRHHPPQNPLPHRAAHLRRRGSIYAMVLGMTMLITVIGIGALATSRVTTRAAGVGIEWEEAGLIAFSAAEHAVAKLNSEATASPSTWRDAYTSGAIAFTQPFGHGTMQWVLTDTSDGILNNDYAAAFQLYGIGRVGNTKRVYSVQVNASGEGLDVLRTAMHASSQISLGGSAIVLDGPVSGNDKLDNASNIRGGVPTEITGSGGTYAPAQPMPPATVFDSYKARATTIASSNAASGAMTPGTLTATSNPYGSANSEGIYYLRLPSGVSTLTINSSRLSATLLIESADGSDGQKLVLKAPMYWEPARADLPSLITRNIKTVTINGGAPVYTEFLTSYPSELRGLFHMIGSSEVQLNDGAFIRGCLVADGKITTSGTIGINATPSLQTTPPAGYTKGNKLVPAPGTWKWDALPTGVN